MESRNCIYCNTSQVSGEDFCNKECEKKAVAKVKLRNLEQKVIQAAMNWYQHGQKTAELHGACMDLKRYRDA